MIFENTDALGLGNSEVTGRKVKNPPRIFWGARATLRDTVDLNINVL
jgi:hypothetical protein